MIESVAENLGARDIFVLKRLEEDRLFNIGGLGRGAGWAGNVSVSSTNEPWIAKALEEGVASRVSGVPFRAFGPYWATEVTGILSGEHVVVLSGPGVSRIAVEKLEAAARDVIAAVSDGVPPAKLDADEAEILQAVEALKEVRAGSIEEIARHLASTTARSLSCEFGAVLLFGPPVRLVISDEGWQPAAGEQEIVAALMPLRQVATNDVYIEQDLSMSPFPYRPLSFEDGLVARCVVPLGPGGSTGMLIAAHAGTAPRGFTLLCQRVARSMGDAGEPLLAAAHN